MIHRYWTGEDQPPLGEWGKQVVEGLCGPVTDWNDDTLDAAWLSYIEKNEKKVPEGQRLRHRANMVRWLILRDRGGIWLDHDVLPLVDLRREASPWTADILGARFVGAMAFPPGHPLCVQALEEIERHEGGPSPEVSGSGLLKRIAPPSLGRVQLVFDADGRFYRNGKILHLWASRWP
jgi:hypothetical protein